MLVGGYPIEVRLAAIGGGVELVVNSADITDVFFVLDEAHSLFLGGNASLPIGGAGVSQFQLAEELSKDDSLRVTWVFSEVLDISSLAHPRIHIRQMSGEPPAPNADSPTPDLAPCADPVWGTGDRRVLVTAPWMLAAPWWRRAALTGLKTVIRVASDGDLRDARDGGGAGHMRLLAQGADPFVRESVSHVILDSESQLSQFESFSDCPASLIPKGWPQKKRPDTAEARDIILWVGSCRAVKQPWMFIDAARAIPAERFVMVLPPFMGKRDELHDMMVRDAHQVPNLEVVDHQIPLGQVDEMFSRAKLFINTSETEGHPSTYMQAGAAGVAVVATSVDPDRIIATNNFGFVGDGSLVSLVGGIQLLLRDGGRNALLAGERYQQHFLEHHDLKSVAAAYRTVIEWVIV